MLRKKRTRKQIHTIEATPQLSSNLLSSGFSLLNLVTRAYPIKLIILTSMGLHLSLSSLTPHASSFDGEEPKLEQPGPLELRALDYIRFRKDIAEIEANALDRASATRDAHNRLAAHESWTLSSGWMAYAALVAADTPAFSESLKAELRGENDIPEGKKQKKRKKKKKKSKKAKGLSEEELKEAQNRFLSKLSANPRYPRQLAGAQEAISAVMAIAQSDHSRVTALGEEYKSKAYSLQKTSWGKKRLPSSKTRISEAEYYANSRPGIAMPTFATTRSDGVKQPGIITSDYTEWTPNWGYKTYNTIQHASGSDAIMDRILNLAARYAVGSLNNRVVSAYAKNNKSEQCLAIARLTLNQCIAATRTPYEEAFCLGEHAIKDVGDCVNWVVKR